MTTATIANQGNIDSSAFYGCTGLTSATLGEAVAAIGDKAFYNCSALSEIVMPYALTTLSTSAFEGCSSLGNVAIGSGVLTLPQRVFYGCSSLTSLTIPANVTSVANYAVGGCTSLSNLFIEAVEKPKGPEEVPAAITFPDWTSTNHDNSSTSYLEYTFSAAAGDVLSFNYSVSSESGCDLLIVELNGSQIVKASGSVSNTYSQTSSEAGLYTLYLSYTKNSSTSDGTDEATVTDIWVKGAGASVDVLKLGSNDSNPLFVECPLEYVYIGRKLSYQTTSSYGYSPFFRNESLREVEFSDAEDQISENAFYECYNLQTLNLGNGVKSIGKMAFCGCLGLATISGNDAVTLIGDDAFLDTAYDSSLPEGEAYIGKVLYRYVGAMPEGTDYEVEEGLTQVYNSVFAGCEGLKSVRVPESVEVVGTSAFAECTNLERIDIADGTKSIGAECFSGCSNLTMAYFGSTLEAIGENAFTSCTSMLHLEVNAVVPPVCEAEALDGLDKSICTLIVPEEGLLDYFLADQWKDFYKISDNCDLAVDQLLIDGGVLHCNGVPTDVFTLSGMKVYSGCGDVELSAGTYIVVADGHATKVAVK